MESLRHKIARLAVRNRWVTLGIALAITLFFGYGLLHIEARTIFSDLFPKTHPFVQAFKDHPNFGNPLTVTVMAVSPSFVMFKMSTIIAGAKFVSVPLKEDFSLDWEQVIREAEKHQPALTFIAYPNNPTGTYISFDEVKRLHAGLPSHVVLVLDAAYAEYVRKNDYASGIELVSTNENVVMTRTFSKIYGLALLRLGWCYGPAGIIDALNRIRGPFNVSGPALEAGIAALKDEDHLSKALAHNDKWLPWLESEISKLGIRVTPSVGNFLLLHFPKVPGKTAKEADAFLSSHGLILRGVGAYGLPDCLRLTIGPDEANKKVVECLTQFMTRS